MRKKVVHVNSGKPRAIHDGSAAFTLFLGNKLVELNVFK